MDVGAPPAPPDGEATGAFRRVVLKLSGEALMGSEPYGIDPERIGVIARQVRDAVGRGAEVAIVVGAGNIFRGLQGASIGMDRATADYMGMIATVLNALAIQDALEKLGLVTGSSRRSPCRRWPSRTSGGAPSATSRRGGS